MRGASGGGGGALAVQVWAVPLDGGAAAAVPTLAPDEEERARRFAFEADRRRYRACRAALRAILGSLLGVPPAALRFAYGRHGKPALARPAADLRFSVSHCEDLALIAVARGAEIGVDLERLRPVPELEGITARFFTPAERALILCAQHDLRREAFFRHWTIKEAWLKCRGDGLSGPLTDVEVRWEASGAPFLRRVASGHTVGCAVSQWSPRQGYVAAIAATPQASDGENECYIRNR